MISLFCPLKNQSVPLVAAHRTEPPKLTKRKGQWEIFLKTRPYNGLTDFFPFCIVRAACCRKEAKKENL